MIGLSVGTSWQIQTKDKIVIIEESGHGDRVDQVFQHLKQSGVLDEAKAILLGDAAKIL